MFPPRRIVCLTEETVETLYLLGEDARIVGVSGYAAVAPHSPTRRRCARLRPADRASRPSLRSGTRFGAAETCRIIPRSDARMDTGNLFARMFVTARRKPPSKPG